MKRLGNLVVALATGGLRSGGCERSGHRVPDRAGTGSRTPARLSLLDRLPGTPKWEMADRGYAEAFDTTCDLRARRPTKRSLSVGAGAPGLGKLVVAPDQRTARAYVDLLQSWTPPAQAEREARLATSDERDATETLAAFRLTPGPSSLVTVAMAYEGLDAPKVAVAAALTPSARAPGWSR